MSDAKAIAKLNDKLRTTFQEDSANKIFITEGVSALPTNDLIIRSLPGFRGHNTQLGRLIQ